MDPVFVEETENLKRVENRLDQIISSHEARKAVLQKELSGFVSYDYEDRTRYIEMPPLVFPGDDTHNFSISHGEATL